jgi:cobalt transporter subunit CbtA
MGRAFRHIILVAALAGLIAGAVASAAQWAGVVPLIFEAETYETAAATHDADPVADSVADPGAVHESWAPEDGFERGAFTVLTNALAGVGFGLLLVAGIHLTGGPTGRSDWRRGLVWGVCGFLTFTLAPALGLPPELPGAEAAPLAGRQLWWFATVAATGGGLALIILKRRAWAIGLGLALILLPHLVGAPSPEQHGGLAPESLARAFVAAALVTSLIFWLVLGGAAGFLYRRI